MSEACHKLQVAVLRDLEGKALRERAKPRVPREFRVWGRAKRTHHTMRGKVCIIVYYPILTYIILILVCSVAYPHTLACASIGVHIIACASMR